MKTKIGFTIEPELLREIDSLGSITKRAQKIRQRHVTCLKEITQSRLEEEQVSIEARIFESVLKCENKLEDGKLTTQVVTDEFNEGLPEKEKATAGS
jgi:hypothetical protein